ncbi:MAG: cyclic nucleotide-binding domain-containing protein [Leptospirales bacterium]|nr:cyclic nucleotide-binding domain-containing protein [Leptospirales bacterium]
MNYINSLLKTLPFLLHFNSEELDYFSRTGRLVFVKKGQLVDIHKTNSLNIVIDGIFEIESISNKDIVYLSQGSFFGSLPFIENKKKGNIKALVDSKVFVIGEDDFYKLFLMSHKALRGYIKMMENLNFDISDLGKRYFNTKGKVITVFGKKSGSGKTLLSSLLGLSISKDNEKTIILDLSYSGTSVFDLFKQKMTAPLSEKGKGTNETESMLRDRIVKVDKNLHLLNIASSARVKVNPAIMGTVLFILSREYKYIIIDLSDSDTDLRDKVFEQTDFIFTLVDSKKDMEDVYPVFDEHLKEGQRVFYVRNLFNSHDRGDFIGGLILNRFNELYIDGNLTVLENFINEGNMSPFTNAIKTKSRALVIESTQYESILLSSLLTELNKTENFFQYIYSSSYSYFLICLMLLFDDNSQFESNLKKFFSPEQFNRNFEITFPENFIFKSNKIIKYAEELSGTKRAEMFNPLPLSNINCAGNQRISSTGSLSRLMAASIVEYPLFEPVAINEADCYSGYPENKVSPSHLLRTEASEIFYISVENRERLSFSDNRYNRFFINYIESIDKEKLSPAEYIEHDKKLILEVSENDYRFDKIYEKTMKLSEMLVSKIV